MLALLPKLPFPVRPFWLANDLGKGIWHPTLAKISQHPACVLPHVTQRAFQPLIVKVSIKEDEVSVGGHDDECVDTQLFVMMRQVSSITNTGSHSTTVNVR